MTRRTFPRFSFDLIYARPQQTLAAWRTELGQALGLAGQHLSLYQLTIEAGTPFAALNALGKLVIPEEARAAEFYELTQTATAAAGLPAYEISNHAMPGEECRHNLLYWRYGEYAGIGAGAHGRVIASNGRWATSTERQPVATFALIARVTDPSRVGGVTGLVGAAGGLGGFVPPLIMGYVYGRTDSYAIGLWMLCVTAALALLLTLTVVRRTATQGQEAR